MFAIHNLSHQGVEPAATFPNLGLPDDWCGGYAARPAESAWETASAALRPCACPRLLSGPLVSMAGFCRFLSL